MLIRVGVGKSVLVVSILETLYAEVGTLKKGIGYIGLGRPGCVTFESAWLHPERQVQTV